MANNFIQLNEGAGGDVLAAEDRGGVKYERVLVEIADSASIDAFGRLRVSEPFTLFQSKLVGGDDSPLFWDEQLESGGGITATTPTAAKPYIDFASTLNVAGVFTRQTFRRFNYQPGKGQLILMTGVLNLSGGGTGVERRIGYFDDDNGLFFEDDAGAIGVTVRSNDTGTPVDTTVTQANWNLDTLDGDDDSENPSGLTVDFSKAQIFVIDFQWLSVGRIRFGVEIMGLPTYVHQVLDANVQPTPYMSTPNLPVRYQMITTGVSPASSMRTICSGVVSEAGQDPTGATQSHATIQHVNANTADELYAIVGIRLKSTALGCDVTPVGISLLSETKDDFEWQLIFNPTVANAFDYTDKTNSCVQVATGSIANPSVNTVSGGTVIERGFLEASGAARITGRLNSLKLGSKIDGTRDTLVLVGRPLSSNADVQGALIWREII